jgi:monoamine oxidase
MYDRFADHVGEVRIVDWCAEPFIGGAYSFPAPGWVTRIMPILRNGLPPIHFAGEHCSAAFVGFMEGAIESGLRVADEIVERTITRQAA